MSNDRTLHDETGKPLIVRGVPWTGEAPGYPVPISGNHEIATNSRVTYATNLISRLRMETTNGAIFKKQVRVILETLMQ